MTGVGASGSDVGAAVGIPTEEQDVAKTQLELPIYAKDQHADDQLYACYVAGLSSDCSFYGRVKKLLAITSIRYLQFMVSVDQKQKQCLSK